MRNVLITGAGGFIGSHLVELAVADGLHIRAFLHYNSNTTWGWLEHSCVRKDIEVVQGDVRDYDSVFTALKGCDTVFHLAALVGIPYSVGAPLAYIRTNIEGTYNILQASRERAVELILITSTSETYGSAQFVPMHEHHPAVGQSPYAATKIGADQLAVSFHRSCGLPVKIVRPFNTYGPRQSARAIIPTIITQLLSGTSSVHLGNLTPTRDFTFVKDAAAGFLAIARAEGLMGEATNIGMQEEISIGDLLTLISSKMGVAASVSADACRMRPQGIEVERLCCDNSKLTSATAWKPRYTLSMGLDETIAWMREHIASFKPGRYTV